GGVDGAAREHPGPAHEASGGVALDEEDLEGLGASAEQDDRRGRARYGLGARVELLSRRWSVVLHRGRVLLAGMTETQTVQRYICQSCGFIYDPADGDPDGGIPPGTAFEDIPDSWFSPVCGARE